MASVYHNSPRTRAATWVPRRVYYVLAYLKRQLTPGKPTAISNKRIQDAIRFGSEGEVSQIMRWLAGELPTMGRWAYGVLNTNAQQHRFITRERMPSGGYLITLLATPAPIGVAAEAPPEIVQLSFLDDPSVIPPPQHSDAARGGSFSESRPQSTDQPRPARANARSQRDHEKETHEESEQQQHGARAQKYDWSRITISGAEFLPWQALEKAGLTPESVQAADRKIATRSEYDRPAQIRILFRSLISHQPIYSAAEIAAQEPPHERPTAARTAAGTRRQSRTHQPGRSADPAPTPDYDAILAEWRAANAT